jgi:hypothetical protein
MFDIDYEIRELERMRDFVCDEYPKLVDKITAFKRSVENIVVSPYGYTDIVTQEFIGELILKRAGMHMAKENLVMRLMAKVKELELKQKEVADGNLEK